MKQLFNDRMLVNGTHETTAFLYRRKVNDEENDDEANEAR